MLVRKLSGVEGPGCGHVTHPRGNQTHGAEAVKHGLSTQVLRRNLTVLSSFFSIQQRTHLEVIEELEAAGCLSCSLDSLSQG